MGSVPNCDYCGQFTAAGLTIDVPPNSGSLVPNDPLCACRECYIGITVGRAKTVDSAIHRAAIARAIILHYDPQRDDELGRHFDDCFEMGDADLVCDYLHAVMLAEPRVHERAKEHGVLTVVTNRVDTYLHAMSRE